MMKKYPCYSQDKFGNEITVIEPCFWTRESHEYGAWKYAMKISERTYLELIAGGARPEQARSVLPNSLKTEIVMTANIREWRHVLTLRCAKSAHPQIREIMLPLLEELAGVLPVLFGDVLEGLK
jgi:thymidylate synthase (FAD)